jgi:rSAM/selenodomain-associated transferase 1
VSALLIIFAKQPQPGRVKTRLCPPLSPAAAARLYQAFLKDTLEEMARVPAVRLALAFSPPGAQDFFQELGPPQCPVFPQEGDDLGERMYRACARGFAAGFGPVLLRGVDLPDLPARVVAEAREVLETGAAPVVLGPAADGGYYLVGIDQPRPRLFQGLAWSGPTVLTDTLRLARQEGLKVHLLPPWHDIDTYTDLERFCLQPAGGPGRRSRQEARRLLGLPLDD